MKRVMRLLFSVSFCIVFCLQPNSAIFCTDYKVDQVNDMALGDESDDHCFCFVVTECDLISQLLRSLLCD